MIKFMSSLIDKYRSCGESKEILRILQKSSFSQENMVWQNLQGRRKIFSVFHLEIDFSARDLVLISEDGFEGLDLSSPLYVKLYHHTTVFKVNAFHLTGHQISFEIPKEVRTPELRSEERLAFELSDQKTVTISSHLRGGSSHLEEMKVLVKDISKFGLGLLISEGNKNFVKKNRIFWITEMGEEKLDTPVMAELVYFSSDLFQSRDKFYKFGLRLSKKFSPQVMRSFLQ
jgi:hypothetical protein